MKNKKLKREKKKQKAREYQNQQSDIIDYDKGKKSIYIIIAMALISTFFIFFTLSSK